MKRSQMLVALTIIFALALAGGFLTACDDGGATAKTPPPTATWTPTPANAVILPAVESGSGAAGNQVSPLATPDAASPMASPTPTPRS